ncbi:M28 family peptidase [Ferruginibacter yonginensis]|uniref:M28 family peptidase n=1 Tax=Ferruginibacter yonginensis TaxID=1310416 RepID=A0ABV8QSR3_9BACT
MKQLLLLPMALLCMHAFAQNDAALKYSNAITAADLKKHLTIIASDEFEGRETGTEGQRKAAAYIEAQFKAIGLKPIPALKGYQQYYPLYQDSLQNTTLNINGTAATFGTDFIIPMNTNESGKFKGKKIVFVGYGIDDAAYSDYTNINVKGKVVVFFLGEPKKDGKYIISGATRGSEWTFPGITKKLATAASKGAVGALVINANQETFNPRTVENGKKTGVYFPSEKNGTKTINYASISHGFAKQLVGDDFNFDSYLASAKTLAPFTINGFEKKMAVNYVFTKGRNTIMASNVLGMIEGTDKKDEYVFLTGHYDHLGKRNGKIYYGADDDGSGTCGVIQMATAFAKAAAAGDKPRRTLVFMTVSGEEKGLWGSEYYSDHPVFPLEKTTVDLNTDMVGRVDTERKTADTLNYVYVIGHDKLSSDLPIINEGMNSKYTNLVLDYKFDDPNDPNRIYFRSDHYNFARKGVPILFFYDGMLKSDYHQPTDTVDKINFELYEKRVKMIFHTAWEIANRNDMLKRDIPLTMGSR